MTGMTSLLPGPVYHRLVVSKVWRSKSDHKIFITPQRCNNTANIFVCEYIVEDALTIGWAAETRFMNITMHLILRLT